jgi:circadian clock protein KaiB
MSTQIVFKMSLFVAGMDAEAAALVATVKDTLASGMLPGACQLDVIDVLEMPEKALAADVFATPMLVRESPLPVLKLMGDITHRQRVMALIQASGNSVAAVIV